MSGTADRAELGEEAAATMLRLLEGREHAKARRDYAILRLLLDLGLRRGSVVALGLAHLYLATDEMSVIRRS